MSAHRPIDPRVQQILHLIEAALSDSTLSVSRIAKQVHLSPSRVRHLVQLYLGKSPKHYVLEKRLQRAQRLFASSFLTVKEVMVAVGMSDPTHFGREFKKMFGVSPSQYRRASHHDCSKSA